MDTMLSESQRFAKYAPAAEALNRAATHCLEAADAAARGNRAGCEWSMGMAAQQQEIAQDALRDATPGFRERVAGIVAWATGRGR